MKLAYIIIAHNQFSQLKRLVERLNQPGTSFVFHISKNCQPGFFEEMIQEYGAQSNMRFAKRQSIYWGDFNIVRAVLNCIDTLVESGFEYDFAISISGQDYPLKSHDAICETLMDSGQSQFLEYYSVNTMEDDDYRRYLSTHLWIKNHHYWYPHTHRDSWKIQLYNKFFSLFLPERRTLPNGYEGYKGSFWWQLSSDCIQYLYDFTQTKPGKKLIRYYTFTYHSAEFFFQTLLLNSPYRDKIINDDNHYAVWFKETGHPKTFTENDLDVIMSSGKLFGRKFDMNVCCKIFDLIDEAVDNPKSTIQ